MDLSGIGGKVNKKRFRKHIQAHNTKVLGDVKRLQWLTDSRHINQKTDIWAKWDHSRHLNGIFNSSIEILIINWKHMPVMLSYIVISLGSYCTVKFGGTFHLLVNLQGFLGAHSIIFTITFILVNQKSSLVTQLMELLWFGWPKYFLGHQINILGNQNSQLK